jgi:oligopeptide/dipeptide ABC transporter ATP-binding protein
MSVDNLKVVYQSLVGPLTALDDVSFTLHPGELLAIVGESGCGKSTLGLSIIGLLPPTASIVNGSVTYKGTDLVRLAGRTIRDYRGTEIAMIFQEPLTSLNPVFRIEEQMAEAIMIREIRKGPRRGAGHYTENGSRHSTKISWSRKVGRVISTDVMNEIIEYIKLVRIADPEQIVHRFPFELSGGMTQRVMIAMALSQEPALLIADEPTTALDVTTQAQVLKLIRELMDEVSTSVLLITHDLAVANQVADRVVVMYAGEIVEDADVQNLFTNPLHPYTRGLLSCVPRTSKLQNTLQPIPGSLPDLRDLPNGCKFAPRCTHAMPHCLGNRPTLVDQQTDPHKLHHRVSCFLYGQ